MGNEKQTFIGMSLAFPYHDELTRHFLNESLDFWPKYEKAENVSIFALKAKQKKWVCISQGWFAWLNKCEILKKLFEDFSTNNTSTLQKTN